MFVEVPEDTRNHAEVVGLCAGVTFACLIRTANRNNQKREGLAQVLARDFRGSGSWLLGHMGLGRPRGSSRIGGEHSSLYCGWGKPGEGQELQSQKEAGKMVVSLTLPLQTQGSDFGCRTTEKLALCTPVVLAVVRWAAEMVHPWKCAGLLA